MAPRKDAATVDLKVRMKEPLRAKIEAAASHHGVSMNFEAVSRLERSFVDDDLFSSPAMKVWAIVTASDFQKAGASQAHLEGMEGATDKQWMADPQSLLRASGAVMRRLVRDLLRTPGTDPEAIGLLIDQLKADLASELVSTGRARWVDKEGNTIDAYAEPVDNDHAR